MTILTTLADVENTVTENPVVGASLWSRILDRIDRLIEMSWNYLNEDMGPVNSEDDFHFPDSFCC